MEKRKFTTTLSVDIIKQLNIIAAVEGFNGLNTTIEYLVKKYVEDNEWGGDLNAIKKD
jgi:hypothetical protein